MPRLSNTAAQPAPAANWQQNIVKRIRSGKLVPVLSNSMTNDLVLGGHDALVQGYPKYCPLPLNGHTLPEMLQFRSIIDETMNDTLALKDDYISYVKNWLFDLAEAGGVAKDILDDVTSNFDQLSFSEFSAQLGYPRFEDAQDDPLLLLASFKLPIYLTTCYHSFLEVALRKAGTQPRTEICRWHRELESLPSAMDSGYEPTPGEPLVYHLFGLDEYSDSLVLTEDDYLRFLVATSQNVGNATDAIHRRVRQAMSESSLMMLGYSLHTWDLRALFWGLLVQRTRPLASIATIQLEPSETEKLYLQRYLDEYKFDVHWGSVHGLVKELAQAIISTQSAKP